MGKEIGDIDEGIILKRPLRKKDFGNDLKIILEFFNAKNKFGEQLKQKIVVNLNDAKEEEYYIIDSKWMDYFMKLYTFKIKKNEQIKNQIE